MSAKKVSISGKPSKKTAPANVDEWVSSQGSNAPDAAANPPAAPEGKMKRLTLDIPEELHKAIKTQCAMRGTKITDELREMLAQKYMKP
jgi:predicted DNA binding CopG/RHH family protein